jgi:hypothetical protein
MPILPDMPNFSIFPVAGPIKPNRDANFGVGTQLFDTRGTL